MSVDLPAPDGPDEEHEVALGDDQVDVAQGDLAVRVLLHDVVQHEDGAIGHGLIAAAIEDAASERAHRRGRCGGDGHGSLRGRVRRLGAGGRERRRWFWTPSAGTAAEATTCPRLPPVRRSAKRDEGDQGPPDDGPVRIGSRAVRGRWAGSGVKSANGRSQHSRIGNWSSRRPARRAGTTARSAVPGSHRAKAPRGMTVVHQVAEDRGQQVRVADRDRPDPAGLACRSRSRAARRPGRWYSQPRRPSLRRKRWSSGWADAEDLAVERVDRRRQAPMPVAIAAGLADDLVEGHRPDARRQRAERGRVAVGQADEVEQRDARDDAQRARTARWRWAGRCRSRSSGWRRARVVAPAAAGADRVEQPPTEPAALQLGQDEAHRQEPQVLALDGAGEGDRPVAVDGDDEALRDRSPGGARTAAAAGASSLGTSGWAIRPM